MRYRPAITTPGRNCPPPTGYPAPAGASPVTDSVRGSSTAASYALPSMEGAREIIRSRAAPESLHRSRHPKSETVGVEFTNMSITSGGDGRDTATDWDRIRSNNPQILYHSARRGYIACSATPETMQADFKIVDAVSTPNAGVKLGGSGVVDAGRPGGARA